VFDGKEARSSAAESYLFIFEFIYLFWLQTFFFLKKVPFHVGFGLDGGELEIEFDHLQFYEDIS